MITVKNRGLISNEMSFEGYDKNEKVEAAKVVEERIRISQWKSSIITKKEKCKYNVVQWIHEQ